MIAMFFGIFIALIGGFIIANSAFTERGTFGFVVVMIGLTIFAGGAIDLILRFL